MLYFRPYLTAILLFSHDLPDPDQKTIDNVIIIARMTKYEESNDPNLERLNWEQITERVNKNLNLPNIDMGAFDVKDIQARMRMINQFESDKKAKWTDLGKDHQEVKDALRFYSI